jgi:hypothetical protein
MGPITSVTYFKGSEQAAIYVDSVLTTVLFVGCLMTANIILFGTHNEMSMNDYDV